MYLSKVAPVPPGTKSETRGHAHGHYESLIEDVFGKKGFLGLGARSGVTHFHAFSWRGVSFFMAEAESDAKMLARELHIPTSKLDYFISYLRRGIRAYAIETAGRSLGDVVFEITQHGVDRTLTHERA